MKPWDTNEIIAWLESPAGDKWRQENVAPVTKLVSVKTDEAPKDDTGTFKIVWHALCPGVRVYLIKLSSVIVTGVFTGIMVIGLRLARISVLIKNDVMRNARS